MNRKHLLFVLLALCVSFIPVQAQNHSIAREWNEVLLQSIRNDFARPTVHARNLFHTSMAMYDAWAAYDTIARPYMLGDTLGDYICPFDGISIPPNIEAARREAISYAVYRVLRYRFQNSPANNSTTIAANLLMTTNGYNPNFTGTDYSNGSAAALGNYIGLNIIQFGLQDQANEQGSYGNTSYQPVNPPLVMAFGGNPDIDDLNRWQPLTLNVFIDQSGNVIPFNTPAFLSPEWGSVDPFALGEEDLTVYKRNGFDYHVYHDPGPPPYIDETIGTDSLSDEYKWGFSLVSTWSSHMSPDDGVMWDISPAAIGNIDSLPTTLNAYRDFYDRLDGGDPSVGHDLNPVTGMPYEEQLVPRGDYTRVLAEFWADGPDSETPPGHWFTLLNYVSDHPLLEKKFEGQMEVLEDLEWDIKSYFILGGAMHDAAITAWGIKGWYDYLRPVSAIRALADLGQSSDQNLPNYNPAGMPLEPDYIELVEAGDPLAGNNGQNIGKVKVYAWQGPDYIISPSFDEAGVGWILAEDWYPYQRPTFVTPNFAGYVSGHSTYSRAAAEVMTMLTGDPFFPGGMGEFEAPEDEFLVFEDGPSMDITLQWATYRDASDQCSLSRIWGGIHPPADDIPGRIAGIEIGHDAFDLAKQYFFRDDDQDGFFYFDDCDDQDATSNPAAVEVCDGRDNDCNGFIDDGLPIFTYYLDNDGDGFGDAGVSLDTCLMMPPVTPSGTGYVVNSTDCNDNNPLVNPVASEVCDDIDNDCNGLVNDDIPFYTYYIDQDGDGFGNAAIIADTCITVPPMGYVENAMDCDDTDAAINPAATEICDAIDNNCDGNADEGLPKNTYYLDNDGDGFGNLVWTADTCIGVPPVGYVDNAMDCDDDDAAINPAAAEICDAIDNNCDGRADEGLPKNTYYLDQDGDGFGDITITTDSCIDVPPIGYVALNIVSLDTLFDCNDSDAGIHPDATDRPDNGIDEDCSGFDLYEMTRLFPNPLDGDLLTIRYNYSGAAKIQVLSVDAKLVRNIDVIVENNFITIDLGDIPAAVYIIRFLNNENRESFVEKLVKMN